MNQPTVFDTELVSRYEMRGPRYTSYPTAVQFNDGFGEASYIAEALQSNESPQPRPLSLYVHIPFCVRKCPYCDFYSISDLSYKNKFLGSLLKEIELAQIPSSVFDTIYIGGGTPSLFTGKDISECCTSTGGGRRASAFFYQWSCRCGGIGTGGAAG